MFSLVVGIDAVQKTMNGRHGLEASSRPGRAPTERPGRRTARALWPSVSAAGVTARVLGRRARATSQPCEESAAL
jgi:hypothetical protein